MVKRFDAIQVVSEEKGNLVKFICPGGCSNWIETYYVIGVQFVGSCEKCGLSFKAVPRAYTIIYHDKAEEEPKGAVKAVKS